MIQTSREVIGNIKSNFDDFDGNNCSGDICGRTTSDDEVAQNNKI